MDQQPNNNPSNTNNGKATVASTNGGSAATRNISLLQMMQRNGQQQERCYTNSNGLCDDEAATPRTVTIMGFDFPPSPFYLSRCCRLMLSFDVVV